LGYGHSLPLVYAMWILVVVMLYLPCRWFMQVKARHRDWAWLSYV
jgi:Fe2+ transport system protein B